MIHDIQCVSCENIKKDVVVKHEQLNSGMVKGFKCEACGKAKFRVYWGHGQAPSGTVTASTTEEKFNRSKTLGEFWDRAGLEVGGKENQKANVKRIQKLREKNKNK